MNLIRDFSYSGDQSRAFAIDGFLTGLLVEADLQSDTSMRNDEELDPILNSLRPLCNLLLSKLKDLDSVPQPAAGVGSSSNPSEDLLAMALRRMREQQSGQLGAVNEGKSKVGRQGRLLFRPERSDLVRLAILLAKYPTTAHVSHLIIT